jgi:predicted PurR-regulated permease PerM
MRTVAAVTLTVALVFVGGPAGAHTCPVVIKQAEELVKKAEGGKVTPETRPLIDEAKKLVGEARAHHENAKTKRDHGDSVRKARTAAAFAEEAIFLHSP